MVDIIAKLTRRQSRGLRGQVGDPGIAGRAQPLMGMAEGSMGSGAASGPPSSGPTRS